MTVFVNKIREWWVSLGFEIAMRFNGHKAHKTELKVDLPQAETVLEIKIQPNAEVTTKSKRVNKAALPWSLRLTRLSNTERLTLFDQLATLIDSGVTLITSLQLIQNQTGSKSLKEVYARIIHNINGGMGLAESMRELPHLFPEMVCALIEAGEKSGNLKAVMAELVEEMEGHQDFVRKITGAMFYPVILIFLCIILVTGMMIFVIPKISIMYKEANVKLPILTQKVIDLSNFISTNGKTIALIVVVSLITLWALVHYLRAGRLFWESLVSNIPVFGKIAREKEIMIFAANLGMLMESGVLITDALEITGKTMGNLHYEAELQRVRHGVTMGRSMSEMMGLEVAGNQSYRSNLFPVSVAQLIHIGEMTGRIGKMLLKIRSNFKKSIDYKLKNISAMIEPLMIFFVAGIVGSVLLAVMLPFFYIGTTVS